jgi:hypothetical protein
MNSPNRLRDDGNPASTAVTSLVASFSRNSAVEDKVKMSGESDQLSRGISDSPHKSRLQFSPAWRIVGVNVGAEPLHGVMSFCVLMVPLPQAQEADKDDTE